MEKNTFKLIYEHKWIDHPLNIITKIDDRVLNVDVSGQPIITIDKKINLQDSDHKLLIEVQNKNESNTTVDANNNVVSDSFIKIKSIEFNEIEVLPAIYTDNLQTFYIDNQKDQVLNKITEIGFNGTWELQFKTPIYKWMLEILF